jgi:hypothetical protein
MGTDHSSVDNLLCLMIGKRLAKSKGKEDYAFIPD